ncbi:preprotein translocase subunit SecG [Candidatus Woesebacteria bacterium RIFCSPHIGHO2_01_FULL_38_9]|uniref:Protein-export membrane protein SecG n=1 Tax=Candidatus Woesebacteria bacterium RIFCSPHIGHO2_01_FULL_38_9 TaxID=1802492 RepID=A0A1F7XYK0_9BACT|nr:MAG: preprotein translocase subunit SecG [Candidatus Woesebacteria bacterium RIFCSPHIGHO2_01_FULL_38_9]
MHALLLSLQILLSVSIVAFILMQPRGTGFARSLGGSASFTRRGLEKFVFRLTFVASGLFLVVSILTLTL